MTDQIITRCGYRCDLCLAYGPNIENNPENPTILSDGWHKYFGFRIEPEDIYCDGCMTDNDELKLIDNDCPVRPCVISQELDNCSGCDNYICENLKDRIVSVEEIEKRIGKKIPESDYKRFIEPYLNKKRLENYRG